ncbi:unnamed protein product [Urochloa decumbens]|uniref:Late embryogenesis abundant protein LEA-2 subgroup domain-containing protein n=1 Tax=Urochloa decumbens TaxID=240449 RepID=A0ABC8WAD6_9POAL
MANGRIGGGGGLGKCCAGFCSFLFAAGFIVLIYWAIFQPHHIRATVETAALSDLAVVSGNNASSAAAAVSYHLAVTLNIYNPSVRVKIYYDAIDAELRFRDAAVIGPAANDTSPSVFFQRGRTRDDVKLEFDYGRPGVAVPGDVAGELEKEMKIGGTVSLELYVDVRVRYVFRMFKLRQKPKIWCSLSIPVKAEGRRRGVGGPIASGERCKVKY